MSVNPEMSESTDYADYRHQTVVLNTVVSNGKGDGTATVEPLQQTGGLRPNQIAELVAVELDLNVKSETANGDLSSVDIRGAIGANIDNDDAPGTQGGQSAGTLDDGSVEQFDSGGVATQDKDGIFAVYISGAGDDYHDFIDFRDITARGPVLDSNDDMNLVHTHVNESGDKSEAQVILKCYWDIAELDDARTEFSIPG